MHIYVHIRMYIRMYSTNILLYLQITGADSARLGSLLYQNAGPYALPNVKADKDHDQEVNVFAYV